MSAPPLRDDPGADEQRALARELMADFAARTGLVGEPPQGRAPERRYLWTDAFAAGNFLRLHRADGETRWLQLALRLVDEVHDTLGRHRPDEPRRGWISGLSEEEGKLHPTRGGLRIGKPLPERAAGEPYDARLEWERDGQYFHYLTKWMQALAQVAAATGDTVYLRWARELAAVAHAAFTYRPHGGGPPRMVWKLSVDLTRPLVPSMGHHDPLDALATYLELEDASPAPGVAASGPDLGREIAEATAMCAEGSWATDDPLGIGGMLDAALRLAAVRAREPGLRALLRRLLADADASLRGYARTLPSTLPADRRLAFRELGLAIGLHRVDELAPRLAGDEELARAAAPLAAQRALAARIDAFWGRDEARAGRTWREHLDINAVMLATSLLAAPS
jgi:hypothetical protein